MAAIASPLDGAVLSGLVPIAGSATHPQFQRYELAFSYSPNPTDTWFTIQEAVAVPVVNDVLAHWDTTRISDGTYNLRLRVFYSDGVLEAVVQNLRLENATPTPASSPTPAVTPTIGPTATVPPAILLPPTSTPRPTATTAPAGDSGPPPAVSPTPRISSSIIGAAFLAGVRLTLIAFLLLGAYVSLKAALRAQR